MRKSVAYNAYQGNRRKHLLLLIIPPYNPQFNRTRFCPGKPVRLTRESDSRYRWGREHVFQQKSRCSLRQRFPPSCEIMAFHLLR
jgi:hypothetical protein